MVEELMNDCFCSTCVFNNSKDDEVAYFTLQHEEMAIDDICNDYDEGNCEDLHHVW